jgi:transcriptional regulator with PAS, ATPase and Fis domain
MPAARLRASIWQSIFTHDMRRYRRTMYRRMADFPTLITGPSGTGKELVARAIAGSRYVAFDANRLEFADESSEAFLPINVAALSPALIESELFGHRRGAFTGAIGDRKGWLETCPSLGSVFLDELGEMDLSLQVKLLRVIETRRFSAVGDTAQREFRGKLIAATNRVLSEEIHAKRFREDLYYRLCADLIETPSLAEQIEDSPDALQDLLVYMTRRAVGDEADRCLPEVREWITTQLPANYRWPGNYRELEQCVRNIVIRRSYRPLQQHTENSREAFFDDFRAGRLPFSEVLSCYAALVYRQTGSYEEAARRLKLDRRTVKAKVQEYLKRMDTPA